MNSEERPATGPDRLQADQQHTAVPHPVKPHFARFRDPGAAIVRRHRVEALRDALSHTQTYVFVENPGYAPRIRRSR